MENKQRYDSIDFLRLLAAIAVVVIHAWPFATYSSSLGISVQSACRFAAPFFFMVSGFFVSKSISKIDDKVALVAYLKRYSLRLLQLYMIWWVIYIPITLTRWNGVNRLAGLEGLELIKATLKLYVFSFFTGSTFLGSWYISATLIGCWIVFYLFRKLGNGPKFTISLIILLAILSLENIGKIMLDSEWLSVYEAFRLKVMIPSQSFVMAVPLLIWGHLINTWENKLNKFPLPMLVTLFLIFNYATMRENLYWNGLKGQFLNDELFFGVLAAVLLMLIGTNLDARKLQIPCASYLRMLSSFMYVAQFGIIVLLRTVARHGILTNSLTRFYITMISIIVLFAVMNWLVTNKKVTFLKRLW